MSVVLNYLLSIVYEKNYVKLGKLSQNPNKNIFQLQPMRVGLVSPDKYCSIRCPHSVVSILVCHCASCALLTPASPANPRPLCRQQVRGGDGRVADQVRAEDRRRHLHLPRPRAAHRRARGARHPAGRGYTRGPGPRVTCVRRCWSRPAGSSSPSTWRAWRRTRWSSSARPSVCRHLLTPGWTETGWT